MNEPIRPDAVPPAEPEPQPIQPGSQPGSGPRSPFDPRQAKPVVSAGCGKPVAIGCGLFLVLFLVTSVIFMVKMYDVLAWTIDKMVMTLEDYEHADDVTPADREALDEARRAAVAKIRSKNIDPAALQRVQSRFMALAGTAKVDHEDYVELTESLRQLAGSAAPVEDDEGVSSSALPAAASGAVAHAGSAAAGARRRR